MLFNGDVSSNDGSFAMPMLLARKNKNTRSGSDGSQIHRKNRPGPLLTDQSEISSLLLLSFQQKMLRYYDITKGILPGN